MFCLFCISDDGWNGLCIADLVDDRSVLILLTASFVGLVGSYVMTLNPYGPVNVGLCSTC